MARTQVYEFGTFRMDMALSRLERAGAPVPLPPKAFDLLVLLARNTDRVMTKVELMDALWPNTFVEEGNLAQHVYTLRKALGDKPDGDPYIETVPRRGYRLAASVREVAGGPSKTPEAAGSIVSDGERKRATVVDCRISNAAALVERLGPQAAQAVMRDLLKMAADDLARYGGVMTEQRLDGFVALFGARQVHEDDPWRAVLTALAIQRSADRLAPERTPDDERPLLRIGIATGPVVVTRRLEAGGIDFSAVGEAMRIADVLQQLAAPGTILLSDTTRGAVDGQIPLESTTLEVDGAAAFRVAGTPAQLVRPPRLMRTLTPFVGRVHELGLLANLVALARAGRGQVACLVGEPGIGKSRLLLEFTTAMTDLTVLKARCLSYGSLVPYLPLADLVRSYCGTTDADTPDDLRRAVRTVLAPTNLPQDMETWPLRLLGVSDDVHDAVSPEAIKARTFDVLRTLLLHASTIRPVVIIVEDVHWIDRSSEEFLAALVERIVAARMLIVLTCRPGYHAPWRDRSHVTQLMLTPLAAADGETLIDAVAREIRIPPQVSAQILAKAEGNPFFLEELTRAALQHGPDDRVPDTVHGVIMARVDRLPDAAKHLLQTASVLGREAPLRLLRRIWRGTPEIAALLDELCDMEFLYEKSGGVEPAFVFRHALTQDVAYDSLLAHQRRDLHLGAARALEDLYGTRLDEITATLAYHYARTDSIHEAVTWLVRAADHAARVYANAEAILHLELARRRLERCPEGPLRDRREAEIALKNAHSLYFLGRWRESVDILLPCNAKLARLSDAGLMAAYAFWLGHMYTRLGDQQRATEQAQRAIDAGMRAGEWATVGNAHGVLALDAHWSGDTANGLVHGEEAVRILRTLPDQRWWLGMAHFYLAMNHLIAGDFEAAMGEAANARKVGEELDDPRLQTYAGFMEAWVEASRGNYKEALIASRRSREQAPDRVSHAFASTILGYTLLESGEPRAARDELKPLLAEFESFGFPQWQGWVSTLVGETYRLDGDLDTAGAFVQRGLDVAIRTRYWYAVGFGERSAGRIARDRGHLGESSAASARALQTFERIGARFEEARTRHEAARTLN